MKKKSSMIGTKEFLVKIERKYGDIHPIVLLVRGRNSGEARERAVREIWGNFAFFDDSLKQVKWDNLSDPKAAIYRSKFSSVPITGEIKIEVEEPLNV